MAIITLSRVRGGDEVGAKASALAVLLGEGLPVPRGFCVTPGSLDDLESEAVAAELGRAVEDLGAERVAVRSSALGEDGASSSFAGVHASVLNVPAGVDSLRDALLQVQASASSPRAEAYRAALGLGGTVRMAALVQVMVDPVSSGVMFTAHPVTGEPEFLVEASWGLGQSTVSEGAVPDRFTVDASGRVTGRVVARKERMIAAARDGVAAVDVVPGLREAPSLTEAELQDQVKLGRTCEALLGCPQDVEWALSEGRFWILQSRPITV